MYDCPMNTMTNTTDKVTIARNLANALNYSFEAYMNEYSIASLNRADAEREEAKAVAQDNGFSVDDLVENVNGTWRPIA